jgi:8-oxo-dGTP pyrophosphatase MutT (NUDIX family)
MRKKGMIAVFPIRYRNNTLEFLLIKRATLSYNWQWVTGSIEKGETSLEGAKRELMEETGYNPALIIPFIIPKEFYTEPEQEDLILWRETGQTIKKLQKIKKRLIIYHFLVRIDDLQDPALNSTEHTDWKWCDYETAFKIILWLGEKKILRYVHNYLIENPLI